VLCQVWPPFKNSAYSRTAACTARPRSGGSCRPALPSGAVSAPRPCGPTRRPAGARQGCGKTTLVEQLEALFEHVGTRCAGVSVDDFYLTFADQQALAKARFAAARAG